MLTEQNYVTIQKIIAESTYNQMPKSYFGPELIHKTKLVKMLSNYFELDNRRFNRRMFEIGCDS